MSLVRNVLNSGFVQNLLLGLVGLLLLGVVFGQLMVMQQLSGLKRAEPTPFPLPSLLPTSTELPASVEESLAPVATATPTASPRVRRAATPTPQPETEEVQ